MTDSWDELAEHWIRAAYQYAEADTTVKPLKRNAARCDRCGTTIESVHRHDFRTCKCGDVSVDGGLDYARRVFTEGASFTDLVEANPEAAQDDEGT